jgi:hypothetical protein
MFSPLTRQAERQVRALCGILAVGPGMPNTTSLLPALISLSRKAIPLAVFFRSSIPKDRAPRTPGSDCRDILQRSQRIPIARPLRESAPQTTGGAHQSPRALALRLRLPAGLPLPLKTCTAENVPIPSQINTVPKMAGNVGGLECEPLKAGCWGTPVAAVSECLTDTASKATLCGIGWHVGRPAVT